MRSGGSIGHRVATLCRCDDRRKVVALEPNFAVRLGNSRTAVSLRTTWSILAAQSKGQSKWGQSKWGQTLMALG